MNCSGRVAQVAGVHDASGPRIEAFFVDRSLLPLFAKYLPSLDTVRHVVVMDDGAPCEIPDDPRIVRWEDVVDGADPVEFRDRIKDENQAAALCYTTGTTGNPKASCTATARPGCTRWRR